MATQTSSGGQTNGRNVFIKFERESRLKPKLERILTEMRKRVD